MSIKSQENERAKFAYEIVQAYKTWCEEECPNEDKKKLRSCYISYVKNVPSYIKINGLLATLAFIKDRKKNEKKIEGKVYQKLYSTINQWLQKQGLIEETDDFIEKIFDMSSSAYKLTTGEVLSLFGWMKRFAESELSDY